MIDFQVPPDLNLKLIGLHLPRPRSQRGELSDSDLQRARDAGLTDAAIVEVVANVVLNIFMNYLDHVARTVVDFPQVRPGAA